jgi:hypothetical protein
MGANLRVYFKYNILEIDVIKPKFVRVMVGDSTNVLASKRTCEYLVSKGSDGWQIGAIFASSALPSRLPIPLPGMPYGSLTNSSVAWSIRGVPVPLLATGKSSVLPPGSTMPSRVQTGVSGLSFPVLGVPILTNGQLPPASTLNPPARAIRIPSMTLGPDSNSAKLYLSRGPPAYPSLGKITTSGLITNRTRQQFILMPGAGPVPLSSNLSLTNLMPLGN